MGSDIHLFCEGIKPAWEDPNNCKGGHWTIRLKKGLTSYYWEELLFAVIGEQFDVGNEICGLSCCIRHGEDVLSLWNRSADRRDVCDKINEVGISKSHAPPSIILQIQSYNRTNNNCVVFLV